VDRQRVLVVRCHACQHLSEELLQKLCRHAVQAAVMPCCQKDRSPVATWKDTAQSLRFSVEMMMDLQLAGRAMSWNVDISYGAVYDVHMKVIKKNDYSSKQVHFVPYLACNGCFVNGFVVHGQPTLQVRSCLDLLQ
jgi:hypothetical protein